MTFIDPRMARALKPVAKAYDVAHVRFSRPDFDKASRFLADFGCRPDVTLPSLRTFNAAGGYGPAIILEPGPPRFLGLGLLVSSRQDLDALAALPGASGIEAAAYWPDGLQVRLSDPAGFEVRALFGSKTEPKSPRRPLEQNLDGCLPRLNAMQRPDLRPATVLRLGHVVLGVVDFFKCVRWYMDTFGLVPSDIQTVGKEDPVVVFMRCDRGDEPTDHHTVVITQNVVNTYSHSAYECIDIDDIAMGQEYLNGKGWVHAWGMGRHLLGSQIFDYWRDPWGDKFEHFVDSDMFTADRPPDILPLSSGALFQWGPPLPSDFEKPKLTPRLLWAALRNIRRSNELTISRVMQILKAIKAPSRPWQRH